MEIEGDGNGNDGSHSQQPSSSDSGQALALGKMIMEEAQKTGGREGTTTIFTIVLQGNGVRAHRMEMQSSVENLSARGTRNDSPKEKVLQLTFIGEVPDTVCTSKVLESKNGECLKLAIVDSETGEIMDSVSKPCAEVVVLEGKRNVTLENFERRIIKRGEKEKPHFVNRVCIDLVKGIGDLTDVKLAQVSAWTKKFMCRLGARIIGQNLYAWTSPFEVIDKRLEDSKNKNEKHYPPFLSSEVWRLKEIGKDGKRHERLKGKDIVTVSGFLFWFHVDPEELKEIILLGGRGRGRGNSDWEAIVKHAKSCTIDDDQRMHYDYDQSLYCHKSSSEPQMSVVYTAVGKLKGVINGSGFVRIDDLSADKKDAAHKVLKSVLELPAFGHRYDIFFNDEASLLQQNPLTDPQNSCGAAPVNPGLENHCPPISSPSEEPQINAGASENEMRKNSCRPSKTNSFRENGAQDSGSFISITDRTEISYDATSFQGSKTFFDDGASYLLEFPHIDPQNFDEATHLDPDFLGPSFEDLYFRTSLLSEIHEINAGASENLEINADACGSASSGFFVGVEDEIEQLRGECCEHPIDSGTRSAHWRVMLSVLKWRLSIKRIRTRVVRDTRKRKR